MSHYIKQATSTKKAFYIGKTRTNPSTQRGNPTNNKIKDWIQQYGFISWKTIMEIPDYQVHPEFGESYLINCFKDKFPHLELLNVGVPHSGAINYDKKSELFIDRLKKMAYIN
jgi:hypothetical protein